MSASEASRPSLREALVRTIGQIFAACSALMVYSLAFEMTTPSAVARAGTSGLLEAAAFCILIPAVFATVVGLVLVGLEHALQRVGLVVSGVLSGLAVGFVIAVALLVFAENLVYSASGWGLNRSESLLPKIGFGVFVGCAGAYAVLRLRGTRTRTWAIVCAAMGVLLIPSVFVAGRYLADTPAPPTVSRSVSNPLNVVILSSDAVETEHMSAYGYERNTTPFLATHVDEFMRFENAFTNNGNTTGSIVSLLTGKTPLATGVVYPPDQLPAEQAQESLPVILAEAGYATYNWAVPHYSDAEDQNLARAFDLDNGDEQRGALLEDATGVGLAGWFTRHTLSRARDLVLDVTNIEEMDNPFAQVATVAGNTITDDERLQGVKDAIGGRVPFFVNTHFMSTHGPGYSNLAHRTFSKGREQEERWETDFYDDSILSFDDRIEAVYEALEAAGVLDETILIVTSDHGIDYDPAKRVPLLIRLPAAHSAGLFDVNVQRVDVAPTVLDAVGMEPPVWMTGSSLLDPASIPVDREILTAVSSAREFSHNHGFHAGMSDVVTYSIRCREFEKREPTGKLTSGEIAGSTATCSAPPGKPPVPRDVG